MSFSLVIRIPNSHAFARATVAVAVLILGISTASTGHAQSDGAPAPLEPIYASADEKVDTSFRLAIDRAILIDRKLTAKGSLGSAKIDFESGTLLVDRHLKNTDKKEEATREYLKCYAKTNGDTSDPAYHGMTVNYQADEEGVEVQLKGDRILPTALLNQLLGDFDSLSLWTAFPQSIKVGDKAKLNLSFVAPLLGFNGHGLSEAKGSVKLKSYETQGRIATFEGNVEFVTFGFIGGYYSTTTVKGRCTIVTSKTERCIRSIMFDGTFNMSLSGSSLKGSGNYTVELKTEVDPQKVRIARKKNYRTRDNIFRVPGLGVGVKLPSYYAQMRTDYPNRMWALTKDSDRGLAFIELSALQGDTTQKNLFFDKVFGSVKREYPNAKMKKARARIGEGRVYYIPVGKGEDTTFVQSEVYVMKNQYLFVRLSGAPRAFRNAVKDFGKARKSIGYLKK